MSNYISATLPAEDQQKALEHIAQLRSILGFGIKLSNDQKRLMAKVDDNRMPFVEKSLGYGSQEPRIVPPFTHLDEYTRDLELFKALRQIEVELTSLTELVSDTRIAAGTDAFQAALSIYNSAKGAVKNGIPGTQSMVDDMGKAFEGQRNTKETTTSVSA